MKKKQTLRKRSSKDKIIKSIKDTPENVARALFGMKSTRQPKSKSRKNGSAEIYDYP